MFKCDYWYKLKVFKLILYKVFIRNKVYTNFIVSSLTKVLFHLYVNINDLPVKYKLDNSLL